MTTPETTADDGAAATKGADGAPEQAARFDLDGVAAALDAPAFVVRYWAIRLTPQGASPVGGGPRRFSRADVALLVGAASMLRADGKSLSELETILRLKGPASMVARATASGALDAALKAMGDEDGATVAGDGAPVERPSISRGAFRRAIDPESTIRLQNMHDALAQIRAQLIAAGARVAPA